MESDKLRLLFAAAKKGDFTALARLLSQAESLGTALFGALPQLLPPSQPVFRIGITGPPGAGKSTLIAGLIKEFRQKGFSIGILAVDPSSPFTKGAILGDRIRYSEHFLDKQVFIRSLGTRGSLGGLSASAYMMLRIFDHMPFDVILIETVGVGQTELEIVNVADVVTVVLVPESGDSIQAMKAGLTEIADLFVVNKSDRPGADALVREIEATQDKPVLKIVATQSVGVKELSSSVMGLRPKDLRKHREDPTRLQQEALALMRGEWERQMFDKVKGIKGIQGFQDLLLSKDL